MNATTGSRIAGLFALLAATAATASAQSMFRGDPAHTGVYAGAAPRELHGVKWTFATGGPVLSSPVLDKGAVYFGSGDGNVYAVEAETGVQRWAFNTRGAVHSTPAVDQGLVFALSYDGGLYALDEVTGKQRWRFATGGERRFEAKGLHGLPPRNQTLFDAWDMFLSSPVVGQGAIYFGSGDGNIYAVDETTGALRWKFTTGDVVHASPASDGSTIYVGSWDSTLYALDAASGRERWRFKAGDDPVMHNQVGFQGSPAVANGTVYVGCRDAHLYALDAATGKPRWNLPTHGSWIVASPAVTQGRVIVGTSDSKLLHVLDAASGKPVYEHTENTYLFSSPAVAGDTIFLGKMNGGLVALDFATGRPLWEYQTERSKQNAGWLLNADRSHNSDTTFLSGDYGTGPGVDRLFSLGVVASSPLVANGVVYFGSTDGFVYALR
jgi:outer membrane protein assembly factor BamB